MIELLLLAISLELSATVLSGTGWAETANDRAEKEIECPIRFEFVGTKYRYINECTGHGKNKIVEFGQYAIGSNSVIFTDRMVVVGTESIFGEDAKQVTLELRHYHSSSMTLAFDEYVLMLEAVDQVEW